MSRRRRVGRPSRASLAGEREVQGSSLPEIIRTDRLALRPFSLTDASAVLSYSQDADWSRFQQTTPRSERDAERVVAELVLRDRAEEPVWAMVGSGTVIGIVSLIFRAGHRVARLGYGIHRDHRGMGLTEEAVRAVLYEAFAAHEQLTKVTAHIDPANERSVRLLTRLGFSHEGTLRSNVLAKGKLVDHTVYGLLRSEWCATKG